MDNIDAMLMKEYAQKRAKAERIAAANLSRARKVPAFVKLEKIEKEIEFELSKLLATTPKSEKVKQLAGVLKEVRSEKAKILKLLKMTETDLYPKYSCKKCNDTGFINGKMCDCYRARKTTEMSKAFGLGEDEFLDFSNFNLDLISDPAQKAQMQKLKDKLSKWAKDYPKNKKRNIMICGGTGLGKTYIAKCLAGTLLRRGIGVCFVSSFNMNQMFLNFHTGNRHEKYESIAPLLSADVLVIDDLGTEPMLKNVTKNYLTLIISERERMGKPVIITTNLMPDHLLDRYNERVYSRLTSKQNSAIFHLDGKDLRLLQQSQRER